MKLSQVWFLWLLQYSDSFKLYDTMLLLKYDDEAADDDFDYERKRKIRLVLLELEFNIEYMGENPKKYDIIDIKK